MGTNRKTENGGGPEGSSNGKEGESFSRLPFFALLEGCFDLRFFCGLTVKEGRVVQTG